MYELPKNYHVRVTKENQSVLAKWLQMVSPQYLTEEHIVGMTYFGGKLRRGWNPKNKIKDVGPEGWDFGEEITYEQFKEYVLGEKFSLPDKWCIKNYLEVGEWFNKQMGEKCLSYEANFEEYLHSYNEMDGSIVNKTGDYKRFSYFRAVPLGEFDKNFTEITLEQFRKYVVNIPQEDYSYLIPIFKNLHIT